MRRLKKAKPAHRANDAELQNDRICPLVVFIDSAPSGQLQAAVLASRFGISPPTARLIAGLAFGEVNR